MTYILEVDGKTLPDSQLVASFRVRQKLSLPTQCEATFLTDAKSKWHERLKVGAILRVRISKPYPAGVLFEGPVSAFEYSFYPDDPAQVRVRAYDALYLLRKSQRATSYTDCNLSGLAGKILQAAGATGVSASFSSGATSPVWKRLIQGGVTDLKFLASRCATCGVYFSLHGKKLHFFTPSGIDGLKVELAGDSLLEANFEFNGLNFRDKVTGAAWNTRRGETFRGSAASARVSRQGGGAAKARKLAGAKALELCNLTTEDAAQATKIAQAELDLHAANAVCFRGVVPGNPALRPGTVLKIHGLEPNEINGEFMIAEAEHGYSAERGFVSELSTEITPPAKPANASTLLLGKVSKVNDPDGLGRVQVTYPTLQDVESDWLQVILPGVGKGKGFVALPGIGDLVAVLCFGDDLAHGLVLGSILGLNKPKVAPVVGGEVKKFSLHSAKGLELLLDDAQGVLSLACENGGAIKISADGITLSGKKITLKNG